MSARKNPPSFVLIDTTDGTVVYTKRATGMGNEAINKCVWAGRNKAQKTGRTYVVYLDIRGLKVGMKVNMPAIYAMGVTETITPTSHTNPGRVRRSNPSGAPNMVWGMYVLISLNRIYKVRLSPNKISALPGWISIQTGTRLVIDALRKKFGAMDYHDPRVQTVIQMAKSMELEKNPAPVRKNVFTFNNPRNYYSKGVRDAVNDAVKRHFDLRGERISGGAIAKMLKRTDNLILAHELSPFNAAHQALIEHLRSRSGVRPNIFTFNNPKGGDNQVEAAARAAGLAVATWAPGDGVTRYRFFLAKRGEVHADYHQGDGVYTALGRKDALNFIRAFGLGKGPKANPLTRKESANLLSRARSVHQRSKSSTQTVAGKNYLRGVADGLTRAVSQYGPSGAQKAVSSMWARTAKSAIRSNACPNPCHLKHRHVRHNPSPIDPPGLAELDARMNDLMRRMDAMKKAKTDGGPEYMILLKEAQAVSKERIKLLGLGGKTIRPNPLLQTVFAANPPDAAAQKREMVNFLKKEFRHLHSDINSADANFDIEGAIYWFANDYHGGGGSALYQILSTSPFTPGPSVRGPEKETMEQLMYDALEQKYARNVHTRRPKKNPPISIAWNAMTRRQREALLEIVGYDRDYQGGMTLGSWSSVPAHAKRKLEAQWLDTTSSGGTTKRRRVAVAVNPLTRPESARILNHARQDLNTAAVFAPGHTRSQKSGQAFARGMVVKQYGPRAARKGAESVMNRAKKTVGTTFTNPGTVRLPKPGTRLTVAEALDLARRIGDRGLIEQCQKALKLQKAANKNAKCVIWKTFAMGSKDKIDSVVALTHYGDSPETMYKPPKGSKKGQHMYRHKWGEGGGGKKTVPLLASADGKMLLMPLEGRKVASDWLRH